MKEAKPVCKACGSEDLIPYTYGLPAAEAFEAEDRDEVALGGCCIGMDMPTHRCRNCGADVGGDGRTNMRGLGKEM